MSRKTRYIPLQAKPADTTSMVRWVGSELERISGAFRSIGGSITLDEPAQSAGNGEVAIGATTATTVGAAGAAAALPAAPSGYLVINVAGTVYKVPYYAS